MSFLFRGMYKLVYVSVKYGVPAATVFSACTFVKNKVQGEKQAYTLSEKEGERQIVIIGGGLSGLMSAYYFTLNPLNKVILMEKERKAALPTNASSLNGGLFDASDSRPKSWKSLLTLVPGVFNQTAGQCTRFTRCGWEPGTVKYLFYYVL